MSRRLRTRVVQFASLLLLAAAFGTPFRALGREHAAGLDTRLTSRIQARLARAGIAAGRYGIVVRERGRVGRTRVRLGAGEPLIPASVAKLLTACTALDLLGPGYRFETLVSVTGPIERGVLDGDLIVHGAGDPGVQATYLGRKDPRYALQDLARQVHAAGIRRVSGAVLLDDGPLDREFTHASWTDADRRSHYGAGVAGLSFHEGCIQIRVTGAARVGQTPLLAFPTTRGPYRYQLAAKTVAGRTSAIGAAFTAASGILRVSGAVPPKRAAEIKIPVPDPVLFYGGALVRTLREAGVQVDGGIRHAVGDAEHAGGLVIAQHIVALAPVLRAMDVHSRNVVASTIFKLCGSRVAATGSWASGEAAVHAVATARQLDDAGTRIVDGSGLSPTNHTTAGLLVRFLAAFDGDILRGPILYDSLATSGVSGTLRKRLRSKDLRGRVHAKTGTLNDVRVRGLAGYVDARDGGPGQIFAILLNGRGANSGVIDDIVRLIAKR